MTMTLKEVAAYYDISEHTLRYYDKINLVPGITRDAHGYRVFSDLAVGWLRYIIAFRSTGMPIADVRHYIELDNQGDVTQSERLAMLEKQAAHLRKQITNLQQQQDLIETKISHFKADTATPHADAPVVKGV